MQNFKGAEKAITAALNDASGPPKKSKSRTRTSRSLPDIKSASATDWDEQAARRAAKHYGDKAARIEAERAAAEADAGPASDAQPYRSPYELVALENKTTRTAKAKPVPAFAHVGGGTL